MGSRLASQEVAPGFIVNWVGFPRGCSFPAFLPRVVARRSSYLALSKPCLPCGGGDNHRKQLLRPGAVQVGFWWHQQSAATTFIPVLSPLIDTSRIKDRYYLGWSVHGAESDYRANRKGGLGREREDKEASKSSKHGFPFEGLI